MSASGLSSYFAAIGDDPVGGAFASRPPIRPRQTRVPVAAEDVPSTWARLMAEPSAPGPRVAYLHIPFCANHCLFCGFYRNAYTPTAAASYADLLVEEIEREAASPGVRQAPVEAVYFGGGTPSALTAGDLARLIRTVRRCLPLAADCEITVEGRIIHFDAEKIDACLDAGCNRISIGVQTFDTAVRRRQGRRSSKEEAIRFLEAIRDRNRAALVIDLMFGLPGQTEAVWREDLAIATALAPDGVDTYRLGLIPGTPLHTAVGAGKFPVMPGLAELGRMFSFAEDYLAGNGWRQISNKHWARTPRERNIYNLRVKQGVDCLAYGSGAGGVIGRHSYALTGDLGAYGEGLRAGKKPLGGLRVADELQPMRNRISAGFEIGRFDLGLIEAPHIDDARALLMPLVEQWREAGLLTLDGDVLDLTTAGRFWYGHLVAAFDNILSEALAPQAAMAMPPHAMPSHAMPPRAIGGARPRPH